MGPRARMLAGIVIMILGIALFFSSVMVIVRYGPISIVMVFVGMFVMAGGAIVLSRSGSAPVGSVASDKPAPMRRPQAAGRVRLRQFWRLVEELFALIETL